MSGKKPRFILPLLIASLLLSMLSLLPVSGAEKASLEVIAPGTAIAVRTWEDIRTSLSDGKVFSGAIERNVRDSRDKVTLLPRGADVELIVRRASDTEYTLDLESVTANGRRMGIDAGPGEPGTLQNVNLTEAPPTGSAGSSLAGTIVGAISWTGGGLETYADPGSLPRRDVQLKTRGTIVKLPAGSLVFFRLEKPLHARVPDRGFSRNGRHFHPGYGTAPGNTKAYEAGLQAGRYDRQRNASFERQTEFWRNEDVTEFHAGYERGFAETPAQDVEGNPHTIHIGADHIVRWNGPPASQVFVRIDNQKRIFSIDESGMMPAPWIRPGRRYVFTLVDSNGKEIAKDENDLRVQKKK